MAAKPPSPSSSGDNVIIRGRRSWNVKLGPIKKHMVAGKLVPTVRSLATMVAKPRRIVLEIVSTNNVAKSQVSTGSDDDIDLDWLLDHANNEWTHGDRVIVHVLKPQRQWGLIRKPAMGQRRFGRRVFGGGSKDDEEEDHDDSSSSSSEDEDDESSSLSITTSTESTTSHAGKNYVEYHHFDLDELSNVQILPGQAKRLLIEATFGRGNQTKVRDVTFSSQEQLNDFVRKLDQLRYMLVESNKKASSDRRKKTEKDDSSPLAATTTTTSSTTSEPKKKTGLFWTSYQKDNDDDKASHAPTVNTKSLGDEEEASEEFDDSVGEDDDAMVNLLFEIVSATDLPDGSDMRKLCDPYVKVWLGTREIHRTSHIDNTCDPIWTVETGSLFLISMPLQEFLASSTVGVTFEIRDYDAVGKDEILGKVVLSQTTILEESLVEYDNKDGDRRKEYLLTNLWKGYDASKHFYAPKLNLRIKTATQEDYKFLKVLHSVVKKRKKKKNKNSSPTALGLYSDAAFVAPKPHKVNRLQRETKTDFTNGNQTLYLVKPGPNPKSLATSQWMTGAQLQDECYQPSSDWIETGSGKLGYLYLEILHCDNLPNLDEPLLMKKRQTKNLTDAFCGIIYEDAIVNTDVINDELSPRWMPWTQRAFVFRMQHLSSQLLVGVFDYDALSKADIVGRVAINVTNLCPNTDYTLTYNLYKESLDDDRQPRGTITVRLRMEIPNFRSAIIASSGVPGPHYVNVPQRGDFRMARFIASGDENMYNLSFDALKAYLKELEGYQDVWFYIQQAVLTVLLWRGHYVIYGNRHGCCGGRKKNPIKIPLHSMVAFGWGIFLIENYNLLPSFLLFTVAWFFLATNEQRHRHPDPWHQCPSFGELWRAFVFGKRKSVSEKDRLDEDELKPLIVEHVAEEKSLKKRRKDREAAKKKNRSLVEEYFAQEEEEANAEEAEEAEIATSAGRFQLRPLKPILLPIQRLLGGLCVSLRVVKSVVVWDESIYAFLITNACLIGSLLLLFVPWGWLIRWVLRIVVWTLLGPWMKLVDIIVVRKLQEDGDNAVKRLEHQMEERSQMLLMRKRTIMMLKEDAYKLRSMKRYMFGHFITRVPSLKEYRYPDTPLPTSTAVPHDNDTYSSVNIVERKHGQTLVGDMIPAWGDEGDDAILTAKASKRKWRPFGRTKKVSVVA